MGWCCIANNIPADGTVKWLQEGWMGPTLRAEKHGGSIAPAQKLNSGFRDRSPFSLLEMGSPVPVLTTQSSHTLRFVIGKFYWEQKEIIGQQSHPNNSQNVTISLRCCISVWEAKVKMYKNGEATGICQVWSCWITLWSPLILTGKWQKKYLSFLWVLHVLPLLSVSTSWKHVGLRRHKYLQEL